MAPIQSDDQTPNHGLNRWTQTPELDEQWQHRTDMDTIETRLVVRDLDANTGTYTAHTDALFIATDDPYNVYQGNGTSWDQIGSLSGGGTSQTFVSVTANYTAADGDAVLVDTSAGDVTITLPSVADAVVDVKLTDATNQATIATPNTETIDGASQLVLDTLHQARTIGFGGTDYWIL